MTTRRTFHSTSMLTSQAAGPTEIKSQKSR